MRKLAIAVALSSTLLAAPAMARDGAIYVGAEIGAMIVEDIDVDLDGDNDVLTLDHDYGFDAGLTVGYDFGAFRAEAEGAFKRADIDELDVTLPIAETHIADSYEVDGQTSVLSFMINGMLDFGDEDLSGFVGGGLGWARVKFDDTRIFSNGNNVIDDSDSGLAWQIIAGVRTALTDNMDVTLKYRFFNAGDLSMDSAGLDAESRFRSHSLLGGIAFNFGGAPPPPPPAPPPPPPPPPPEPAPPPPPVVAPGPFIVFFDWDKSDITPQAAAILDNAAAAYQQTGSAQVMLAGNADKSGTADYNVGLSQRRADAVRAYLAGRGIPEGSMSTEAYGESRPLVETADGVREPQNRNVQITFGPGSGQ